MRTATLAATPTPRAAAPEAAGDQAEPQALPFTVRRAVAKIGRNDPCPCGSGKKYKRCCLEKDRARLSDPSPYAGLTMEEAKRDPLRHGDPNIFYEMSKAELEAVDRAALSPELLRGLVRAHSERGEVVAASGVLTELAARLGGEDHVAEERDGLVYEALVRGDAKFARAEAARRKGEPTFPSQLNRLTVDLAYRPPERLSRLDGYLAQLVDDPRDLTELADAVQLAGLPGLTIAIARAAAVLAGSQEDRHVLGEILAVERERLGLDERDPALRLLGGAKPRRTVRREQAMEELQSRLTEREAAIQTVRSERDRLAAELEKQGLLTARVGSAGVPAVADDEARRLRRKVDELQAELRDKQRERGELQHQLRAARDARDASGDGVRARRGDGPEKQAVEEEGESIPEDAQVQPLRFAAAFYESATDLGDGRLALRAQELAVRFAALDPATWKQAKKMQDLQGVFTLRVGIHHRLFILRHGGTVEARELVTREGFDRMLKLRYRR